MIRTTAVLEDNTIANGLSLEELKAKENEIRWFWTDFNLPDEKEIAELERFFGFHPLAVEDCVNRLQRPKIDYYEGYAFFVLHYLHTEKIQKKEINIFLADRYIVTFHSEKSDQVERAWKEITMGTVTKRWGPFYVFYLILDKTVDDFFPILYDLEDRINVLDEQRKMETLFEQLFQIRRQLLYLRHTIHPMQEIVMEILDSEHLIRHKTDRAYIKDIYDHLLKISEMIESTREITADIRENHLSINTHRTNRIIQVLTVITTIFMPLTLITGIYGMNFSNMPELKWKYGYFAVLIFMALLGTGLYQWFKRNGWLK
ncbi:MAG: magnesium and cobalt transport protein CorA [Caldibacillus debilis]|uniref:Magnesium transport protein CorA n=1 Tax=Caldibacillus debilis TaxID=301148 RepID=A0A3E0K384_9BACI|nr:magnesium/cobalt transporter CorA [Caldibacillus debilis]REJ18120.1 MAG: magnesium and cobalt transport protein CorA [Caldibacillus debilis]REJ27847.1 MAG: magnesium and cobalt transport protein CorA [Caldibacillus debilis]